MCHPWSNIIPALKCLILWYPSYQCVILWYPSYWCVILWYPLYWCVIIRYYFLLVCHPKIFLLVSVSSIWYSFLSVCHVLGYIYIFCRCVIRYSFLLLCHPLISFISVCYPLIFAWVDRFSIFWYLFLGDVLYCLIVHSSCRLAILSYSFLSAVS